jgi:hypothetical protein
MSHKALWVATYGRRDRWEAGSKLPASMASERGWMLKMDAAKWDCSLSFMGNEYGHDGEFFDS